MSLRTLPDADQLSEQIKIDHLSNNSGFRNMIARENNSTLQRKSGSVKTKG
jgi:hypothetical protein